ncbi:phage holin family protein [Afifella pfennigii]|uniref:phage holin family protein n=1 Tax=Afifella pfennigii TaxID=209897 RepID=UPI00047EDCD6|nr:phage holin family protein [Afifella pfennigii]
MFRLLSSISLAYGAANLRRRIRVLVMQAVLAAIGLVILLFAIGYALAALHIFLSQLWTPLVSALAIAGGLFFIGLIVLLLALRPQRETSRAAEQPFKELSQSAENTYRRMQRSLSQSGSPLANPVVQAAGIALIIGVLLGRRR